MTWFARLGLHTGYVSDVLGPLILTGVGLGMVIAPSINTGTFGVAARDAGVASATVTVGRRGALSAEDAPPALPSSLSETPRRGRPAVTAAETGLQERMLPILNRK